MAAPTFVAASTGTTDATGAWTHTSAAPGAAGRLLIVQLLQDGTSASPPTITSVTNAEDLAGTDGVLTFIGSFDVGSAVAAKQLLWAGRSLSTSAMVITGANVGGDDVYVRVYEFQDANTGTTIEEIIENLTGTVMVNQSTGASIITFGSTGAASFQQLAQTFIATEDLGSVRLAMGKTGSPTDNVIVEVQTTSAGVPTGTVLASATIPAASVANPTNVFFDGGVVDLTAATVYALVLSRSGAADAANHYRWLQSSGGDVYVDGDSFTMRNDSSSFVETVGDDYNFTVYSGHLGNTAGTSVAVSDTAVTTSDVDRLALNFVGLNDDASGLAAFAGETGGDWTLATAIYETGTGTDATIGLMQAAMAAAGTIDGGSDTIVSMGWGVVGTALIGTAPAGPVTSLLYRPRPMIRNL